MIHTQRFVTFVGTVVCTLGLATAESLAQAHFFEGFNNAGSVPRWHRTTMALFSHCWEDL